MSGTVIYSNNIICRTVSPLRYFLYRPLPDSLRNYMNLQIAIIFIDESYLAIAVLYYLLNSTCLLAMLLLDNKYLKINKVLRNELIYLNESYTNVLGNINKWFKIVLHKKITSSIESLFLSFVQW